MPRSIKQDRIKAVESAAMVMYGTGMESGALNRLEAIVAFFERYLAQGQELQSGEIVKIAEIKKKSPEREASGDKFQQGELAASESQHVKLKPNQK